MELIKFHTATFEPCETFCLQCSLMLSLIYGGLRVLGPGMKALFVHKLKAWFGKMGLKIPAYAKNYKGGRVSHFKRVFSSFIFLTGEETKWQRLGLQPGSSCPWPSSSTTLESLQMNMQEENKNAISHPR